MLISLVFATGFDLMSPFSGAAFEPPPETLALRVYASNGASLAPPIAGEPACLPATAGFGFGLVVAGALAGFAFGAAAEGVLAGFGFGLVAAGAFAMAGFGFGAPPADSLG
jgi:hypothetical protein